MSVLKFSSNGHGVVTAAVNGVSVTSPAIVQAGARVVVIATPNTGYKFAHWSDDSTVNPKIFTMSGDIELIGSFEQERVVNGASMIYNYEAEILKFFNKCFPEIRQITYAPDEDLLTGLDTAKYYPAVYYSRQNMNIQWDKTIEIPAYKDREGWDDCLYTYHLYPYTQEYTATILIENQQAAFRILNTLRFYWRKNSYIKVAIPGIYERDVAETSEAKLTPVALRLLGLSVEDVRLPNDKNGACRAVRIRWSSNLLLNDNPTSTTGLVEKVVIGLQLLPDGSVEELRKVPLSNN